LFRIAAAWALPPVFSLIAIVALNRAFQLGTPVVLLHISIVMSVVSLAITALAWLVRAGVATTNRGFRVVVSSLAAIAGGLMVALYAGAAIGNRFWDGSINYRIVWEYAQLLAPNRPPFFIPPTVHASALGGIAILFVVAWYWCRAVVRAIHDYGGGTGRAPSRGLRSVAAVATALMIASAGLTAVWAARRNVLYREPIVGFFASVDRFADFNQHVLDLDLPRLELVARERYPKGQTFDRRNVVIIMIDSLRADHMDVYGYERPTTPFLKSLLESGRLKKVALALSTCAESTCGILSTLYSKTLRNIAPHSFSLPALLRDQGYDIYQILSGDHNWNGLRAAYGTDHTFYFDGSSSKQYAVTDDRLLFEGLERVPDFSGKPAFFQFHLMSAHDAGIRLAPYRRYEPATVKMDFDSLFGGTNDRVSLVNNYDNGALQADAIVAQLFERLRTKGYLANSLVVILADHGEGFGEHGSYGHVFSLHQEFIRIPLLIYDDGEYGNLTFATQIDVAPTIVDRLGLAIPPNWEGRSLLESEIKQFSIHQTRKWSPCYAVTYSVPPSLYKYLRCAPESSPEELYELMTDPGERRNLAASAPAHVMEAMRGRLREEMVSSTIKSH
jgi:glucan phosphoethanolaminetransferase (alkaline phosphatase superfamily)